MTNSHVANYISRGKNEAPDENRTERASKLVTLLRPGQLSAVAVVRDCYETVYSLLSQTASWIIPSVFSYTLNIYPRMWKNRNSPSGELPLYRNRRRRHTATCLCVCVHVGCPICILWETKQLAGEKPNETSLAWIFPAESQPLCRIEMRPSLRNEVDQKWEKRGRWNCHEIIELSVIVQ